MSILRNSFMRVGRSPREAHGYSVPSSERQPRGQSVICGASSICSLCYSCGTQEYFKGLPQVRPKILYPCTCVARDISTYATKVRKVLQMLSAPSPQELLFHEHVAGTEKKSFVHLAKVAVCNLGPKIYRKLRESHILDNSKVFISTKVLKHIYDDHHPQHLTMIKNLHRIVRSPEVVYKNKPGKGGDYIFVKEIRDETYCVVLDIIQSETDSSIEIRTCFYASRPKRYFREFECIWSNKK
jgi:hypothetical protein